MIDIQTYSPSPELRKYVYAFWTGNFNFTNSGALFQSVMPNGTIELIIHLSDEKCYLNKNGSGFQASPDYTAIGLRTQVYQVRFLHKVKVFGIRFYPEAIQSIFSVPASGFTDSYEESIHLFGKTIHEWCEQLREKGSTAQRIKLAENFIRRRMHHSPHSVSYVEAAAEMIRQKKGLITIRDLNHSIPISLRQLQRAFGNITGISPKEYIRLTRLNAIHQYMNGIVKPNFTDIAYEFGFADQSHFIREFKSLTGEKPLSFTSKKEQIIVNPGF